MGLRIGVIPARSKPEAAELAEELVPWLAAAGCTVVREDELLRGEPAELLLTIGGDGLIMRVAHNLPDVPILGINLGKVGFLARIERSAWRPALTELIEARYRVEESPTLSASLIRAGEVDERGWAINDVVIRAAMQMVDVELYLDGQFVNTYPGDGMIVSTPQGSTAYCMAAGGPVLAAGVRGFALVPICAHSPIRTTLVAPEDALVELVVPSEKAADLILDGVPSISLRRGDLVQVRRGTHRFRLVILPGMNFYQAFRSKFNFMIRPDAIPSRAEKRVQPR
ncbi:MAG TPA: NAD(+)/NADH kinase [Thermomicrobiaceae bacterium]|nr:NAD(+)/NADH kinase [Thermomicrobiaceae bacterium]